MANYVIYDCDPGCDDAWGLLMLLKGEQHARSGPNGKGYKVLAVTTVHGNANLTDVTKNALRVLDSVDRTDIPLYKGCAKPILLRSWEKIKYFHGRNGFGDIDFDKELDWSLVQPKHAVTAMYDYVCKYPNQVDFILVGPLTNFATCIIMYGEDFLRKVGKIFVMGGNHTAKGNATKSAEFNFYYDPEAANIVFENVLEPIVVVPWETCIDGDFETTLKWRFDVIGAVKSKPIELLNKIESAIFIPKGVIRWIVCDAILVSTYVFPDLTITNSRLYHATVELTGTHTRGQVVIDHLKTKECNAKIVKEVHKDHYLNLIAWTAGVPGFNVKNE